MEGRKADLNQIFAPAGLCFSTSNQDIISSQANLDPFIVGGLHNKLFSGILKPTLSLNGGADTDLNQLLGCSCRTVLHHLT